MNDTSNIQKINSLARELMKHGQASSMDQAISLATERVNSGDIPEYLPQGGQASKEPAKPLPEMSESAELPKGDVSTEDIIAAVERLVSAQQTAVSRMTNVVNQHTSQMQDFSSKINTLIAEITTLRQEVEKLKQSPVAPSLRPKDAGSGQTQFKQEAAPPRPAPEQKKDGSGHARSGNYKPEDVSIEKFFYYGNRK
ncbi:hypothetical protein JW898_03570 [Candidatus Woesearchaeota archaeon]|nr:hypothetical protein [Candidatus Woesearchaeota archaeon]